MLQNLFKGETATHPSRYEGRATQPVATFQKPHAPEGLRMKLRGSQRGSAGASGEFAAAARSAEDADGTTLRMPAAGAVTDVPAAMPDVGLSVSERGMVAEIAGTPVRGTGAVASAARAAVRDAVVASTGGRDAEVRSPVIGAGRAAGMDSAAAAAGDSVADSLRTDEPP